MIDRIGAVKIFIDSHIHPPSSSQCNTSDRNNTSSGLSATGRTITLGRRPLGVPGPGARHQRAVRPPRSPDGPRGQAPRGHTTETDSHTRPVPQQSSRTNARSRATHRKQLTTHRLRTDRARPHRTGSVPGGESLCSNSLRSPSLWVPRCSHFFTTWITSSSSTTCARPTRCGLYLVLRPCGVNRESRTGTGRPAADCTWCSGPAG